MTFKSVIRNILPHFIVTHFSKRERENQDILQYLEMGNSILLENFNIQVGHLRTGKYIKVGNDSMLDCKIIIESEKALVSIGERVFIGCSTIISRSAIEFGNNIFVAWGVTFYDHDSHSMDYEHRQKDIKQQLSDYRSGNSFIKNKNWDVVKSAPIKISDNAWIGMNSIILKGVVIGEGAIVGAGSVVTKNVDPWTVVGGNPAQVIKRLR